MSGVLSGVTKVFSAVGSAAAKVTSSIASVGASVFTAGAATGAGSIAQGGLSNLFGSGTLGKVLSGAVSRAVPGALMGGIAGAVTGQGFMKGAMMGGLGGAAFGGVEAAMGGGGLFQTSAMNNDPTVKDPWGGMRGEDPGIDYTATGSIGGGLMPDAEMPTVPVQKTGRNMTQGGFDMGRFGDPAGAQGIDVLGAIDRTATSPSGQQSGGLLQKGLDFLGSERGGNLLAGLGKGGMEYLQAKQIAEEKEKDREFLRQKQQTITNSYKGTVGQSSAVGNATAQMQAKPRYMFDPGVGRIVMA